MTQTTTQTTGVAPGWYPDGRGSVRYFDGTAWTPHVQSATPTPAPAAPTAPAAAAPAVAAAPVAAAAATGGHAAAQDEDEPFYKQGWFVVDAIVLGLMAVVVIAALVLA